MKSITLLVTDEDYPSWERALSLGSEAALTAHLVTAGTVSQFIDWTERAQAERSRQLYAQGAPRQVATTPELPPPPKNTTSFDIPHPQAPLSLLLRIRNIKRVDVLAGGLVRIHHNRKNADRLGMVFEIMAVVRKYLGQSEGQRSEAAAAEEQRRQQDAWAARAREEAPLIQD